jgi:protein-tyrosine phosphatase
MTLMNDASVPSSIDWVDLTPIATLHGTGGRLGMCGLARAVTLAPEDGIDVVVTLVDTAATFEELAPRTRVVRYPIVDLGVPGDRASFADLVDEIAADVRAGRTVVVSCLAGYGRTGMTVACALIAAGLGAGEAIELVRATRPGTIETDEQLEFVRTWRRD